MTTAWYFNPIMFQIGPVSAHWYGFMYALSFLLGYFYLRYSRHAKHLSQNERDTFLIYIILGIVLGGRIGYILFYNLVYYISYPQKIIAVWEGGMSFHGGLLGSALAIILFSRKYKKKFLELGDIVCGFAPVGLFFAKIGNFINAELYGRIAKSFCIYFPTDPANCRYPSQLLESFLEGTVLFAIVYFVGKKTKKTGIVSAVFLLFYGIFRIIAEQFREPDPQIGFLFGTITEGQLLSSMMVIAGAILLIKLMPIKFKKTDRK
jgi:phosphatidylglycerol---prolipoprotein diacylglyceryl transferase